MKAYYVIVTPHTNGEQIEVYTRTESFDCSRMVTEHWDENENKWVNPGFPYYSDNEKNAAEVKKVVGKLKEHGLNIDLDM